MTIIAKAVNEPSQVKLPKVQAQLSKNEADSSLAWAAKNWARELIEQL